MSALLTEARTIVAGERSSETPAKSPTSTPELAGAKEARPVEKGACGSNSHFLEYFRLFAEIHAIGDMSKVFPKECRVCGRTFGSFAEFIRATQPKGHVFEDCQEVMDRPFTMVYRHCSCSNTLVVTLTADIFPPLVRFWSMLGQEAEQSGKPLSEVVRDFSAQCDRYILNGDGSCPEKAGS